MDARMEPFSTELEVDLSTDISLEIPPLSAFKRGSIMKNITFKSLPRLSTLYLKAGIKRNAKQLKSIPELSLKVSGFKINRKQLSNYLNAFEYENMKGLPAPFLYLATQSIQLYMLTLPEFPLSPAGLVHLGVRFEQRKELPPEWQGDVVMSITNQRHSKKGLVLDIESRFENNTGTVHFIIVSSYLARAVKVRNDDALPKLVSFDEKLFNGGHSFDTSFSVGQNEGRRYARLSGDFNPIHLYGWSAKLFGFKMPIIHGLYMISKVYSELYRQHKALPFEGFFQFKSPLYLPGKADLRLKKNNDHWVVLVNSPDNDHLYGHVVFN